MAVYFNGNADRCGFLRNKNILLGKAEQPCDSNSLILIETAFQHELRYENSKLLLVYLRIWEE